MAKGWLSDEIAARIGTFVTADPAQAGNRAISEMIQLEFGIFVGTHQIAGAVGRLGLPARPHPPRQPVPGSMRDQARQRRVTGSATCAPAREPRYQPESVLDLIVAAADAGREEPRAVSLNSAAAYRDAAANGTAKAAWAKQARATTAATLPSLGAPMPSGEATRVPKLIACQWPVGTPGTPEFHFCGAAPVVSGGTGDYGWQPYCPEHWHAGHTRHGA